MYGIGAPAEIVEVLVQWTRTSGEPMYSSVFKYPSTCIVQRRRQLVEAANRRVRRLLPTIDSVSLHDLAAQRSAHSGDRLGQVERTRLDGQLVPRRQVVRDRRHRWTTLGVQHRRPVDEIIEVACVWMRTVGSPRSYVAPLAPADGREAGSDAARERPHRLRERVHIGCEWIRCRGLVEHLERREVHRSECLALFSQPRPVRQRYKAEVADHRLAAELVQIGWLDVPMGEAVLGLQSRECARDGSYRRHHRRQVRVG